MTKTVTEEEMFRFLDGLRETGATNMFGAGPYLEQAYDIPKYRAHQVLQKWMETFTERHPEES